MLKQSHSNQMKFTISQIEKLEREKDEAGNYKKASLYFDDSITGFGIKVSKSSKSYILNYRFKGTKKRFTIGNTKAITLHQAREQAKILLAEIIKGKDPQLAKQQDRVDKPKFKDLTDRYFKEYSIHNKEVYQKANKYFIEKILQPKLGNRLLEDITKHILSEIIRNFKNSKSERTKQIISGARANRLISLISKLFNLALDWEWVSSNPAKGIKKYKEEKRERIATDEEAKKIIEAIKNEPDPIYRNFFLILWLTMARRSEIQNMKWTDLDLENRTFHLKDTKAGRPFTIPLTEEAILIIQSTPPVAGNAYVFASNKSLGKPINGISKVWKRIKKNANVDSLWIHDIRRTGGSNMSMNGASLQDIAQLLNHSNLTTTQRYAQLAQQHKKNKMDEHGKRLQKLTQGSFSI